MTGGPTAREIETLNFWTAARTFRGGSNLWTFRTAARQIVDQSVHCEFDSVRRAAQRIVADEMTEQDRAQ